jgi:hypothetical protein
LGYGEDVAACDSEMITARLSVRPLIELGKRVVYALISGQVSSQNLSYIWDQLFHTLHTLPFPFLSITMAAFAHSMQVTISLLPVSLSLVHVPRSRLAQLSHPIIRQILQPKPTFLNLTCNEIELSLFAEHHVLADFEPVARDDRRRQRSRSGSGSSRKNVSGSSMEPVEISYEKWNVLQIDSHSDQLGVYVTGFVRPFFAVALIFVLLDKAGARVHELSAPLAAAGISILYQSSYMSDFIMVRSLQ